MAAATTNVLASDLSLFPARVWAPFLEIPKRFAKIRPEYGDIAKISPINLGDFCLRRFEGQFLVS